MVRLIVEVMDQNHYEVLRFEITMHTTPLTQSLIFQAHETYNRNRLSINAFMDMFFPPAKHLIHFVINETM